MLMEVLYRAGEPWVDLAGPIRLAVTTGRAVLWLSWSGTRQLFAWPDDGPFVRARHGVEGSVHPFDGHPLVVHEPWFATSCGTGDAGGYRSTPPLLVAVIAGAGAVEAAMAEARALVERLDTAGFSFDDIPEGHPDRPCGAMLCPLITPEAVVTPPEEHR